jgi:TP901 family phage tail tape measure protein
LAGEYRTEVEVTTSQAVQNLRALKTEVNQTTSAFSALNKLTSEGQKDLSSMVSSVTALMAEQRRAAAVEKDLANAKIASAKATAVQQVAEDKHAESVARQTVNNSRAKAAEAQAVQRTNAAQNDTIRTVTQVANANERAAQAAEQHSARMNSFANANRRAAQSSLELTDNLSNTRYLLYDVGATYRTMSLGLEAIPVAVAAVSSSYQSDFAQVVRVTHESTDANNELRASLKDIATDIPVAFGDLTRITQLGAQMGIPADQLAKFTDTTAKFVAVTGVAADTASSLFGRLDNAYNQNNQIPDFFNKVGSSIAKVGAETVATDPEIASMLNQIGSLGASAGFTADQTIGLAAALSSVRIQPELARGTLTRLFANLDRDVSEGGKTMEAYGRVLHTTGQEAAAMWKQNPSEFFTKLIAGLNATYKSNGDLTGVLDSLNIKATRDVSALTKLAVGYDVLKTSMDSAQQGFADGTTLDEQSKPIFETLAAKLQLFANAWSNLADTLGKGGLAPLAGVIVGITSLVNGLDHFIQQAPGLGVVINLLLGLAAVAGIFMGIKAAQAFVLAGLVSFQQTMGSAAARTLNTTGLLRQFAVVMLMSKGATEAQAQALVRTAGGMQALGTAAATSRERLSSMQTVSSNLDNSMQSAGTTASGFGGKLRGILGVLGGLVGGFGNLALIVGTALVGSFIAAQNAGDDLAKTLGEALGGSAEDAMKAAADAINKFKVSNDPTGGIGFDPGSYDKSLADIASRAGVSIDKLIAALSKGKNGISAFKQYMDQVAKANGFSGIGDFGITNALPGTKGADLYFISQAMERLFDKSTSTASSTDKVNAALKELGIQAPATGSAVEGTGEDIDDLDKKLKDLNDTIFGTINAEAAVGDSLANLGGSLQKSGRFDDSDVGRENLQNFEKTLADAQKYYAQYMHDSGDATAAAQGYAQFVQSLISQIKAQGGDLGSVEDLANQTVTAFKSTIGANATGANAAVMQVTADGTPAVQNALSAGTAVSEVVARTNAQFTVTADGSSAVYSVQNLAQDLATLTGMPFQVVLSALTDPANENAARMQQYITQIVNGTYQTTINADTTAAIANVQNFAAYAQAQLAQVQSWFTSSDGKREGSLQPLGYSPNWTVGGKPMTPPAQVAAAPPKAAPLPTPAALPPMPGGNQLADGFKKAADAADKAGEKGKKAGKDTADGWKDAANGIDQATAAANDYANRVKEGLTSAYDKQYGLNAATDEYYKQLNSIKKAREDELAQVDDLKTKLESLKDDRSKDLIDANKAQIEASISKKYGETDRQLDYESQAKTALDNAAAKQKDIDATQKQLDTVQAGIGEFNGYTDAAIANREALRTLEQKMNDMVVAYAATGASTEQVRAYAAKLGAQFVQQAGDATGNRGAVNALTGDLGRYTDTINRIPYYKPTTVTADVGTPNSGALGAVNAFGSALDWATRDRNPKIWITGTVYETPRRTSDNQIIYGVTDPNTGRPTGTYLFNKGGQVPGFADGGMIPGQSPSDPSIDNLMASVDGKGMVRVRSGEFIMQQPAVDYWGVEFMNAINAMKMPQFNAGGPIGRVSSGGGDGFQVVALDASTLAVLTKLLDRPVELWTQDEIIARSNQRGQTKLASKGVRFS